MKTSRWTHGIIMLAGDAAIFFAVLYSALVLRTLQWPSSDSYWEHVGAFIVLFVLYEIILYIAGFWGRQIIPTTKNIFELLVPAHVTATVLMLGYFYFLPSVGISPKTNLLIFTSLLFVGMYAWKLVGLRLFTLYPIEAITIGPHDDLIDMFEQQPLWNIKVVKQLTRQHGINTILESMRSLRADTVMVDLDRYPRIDMLYKLMFSGVNIVDSVLIREDMTSQVDLERIDSTWFVSHVTQRGTAYRFVKRLMDVTAGLILALVVLLIIPFLYLAIVLDDGGPLLIVQKRMGLQGREFLFYKFRSMSVDDDQWKTKNDANKITRVGKVIRALRIDELAQCINLIRGDISLVGPRAILIREHNTMVKRNPFQQARLLVQPGLTGHAQVTQQHAPADESEALERLAYDLYYIKNLSLWLDIKIILKTLRKVLQRAGIR